MKSEYSVAAVEVESETITNNDLDEPGGTKPRLKERGRINIKEIQVEKDNWYDWKWQLKNSIRSIKDLELVLSEKDISISDEIKEAAKVFSLAITPYYLSLIKDFSYNDPIYKMSIPSSEELLNPSFLSNDPLGEEHDCVVPNLVHRYDDRALLVSTNKCAMNCRFCTRKRVTGSKDFHLTDKELDNAINYLKIHTEIKDVIISGGDPFTMPTSKLENILARLRSVKSIEIIRIGTRTPVTLPMRITDELVDMLSKYHPVWVNTHFNHPNEITDESKQAILRLVNRGIPVNNQNVLLKGINDDSSILSSLYKELLKIRVRPYYLFSCDKVIGTYHFHTKIEKGIEIINNLRGKISGLGIPHYIIDLPDGNGKIPLVPNYIEKVDGDKIIFRNLFNSNTEYINSCE